MRSSERYQPVAQLAEHLVSNQGVGGSSPSGPLVDELMVSSLTGLGAFAPSASY